MAKGTCSIEGCERPHYGRGWCRRHYMRWRNYGDPQAEFQRPTAEERFWAKVDRRGPDECWPWTAGLWGGGYGAFAMPSYGNRYRNVYAHRFAYELLVGPIAEGMVIDHLCRNRACVNPAHLEPVTKRENTLRGTSPIANNRRLTHCRRGHPFDAANTFIDLGGNRHCRACGAERARVRRARSAEERSRG